MSKILSSKQNANQKLGNKNKRFKKGINSTFMSILFVAVYLFHFTPVSAQVVSPLQTGHYMPAFSNVRDLSTPSPGFFVLLYNYYGFTDKYFDRDGNEFSTFPFSQIDPTLPNVDINVSLKSFVTVPVLFWASKKKILGGATYMASLTPNYMWANGTVTINAEGYTDGPLTENSKLSGFGDLCFSPLGLSWGFEKLDFTAIYSITAATGRYEEGADDNIGLGFWTHQPQLFTTYYPVPDKSTAIMFGLTYELNGDLKDADFNPGNRFTLEWGISQYLSEKLELAVQGGHNWQVTDDRGADLIWDPTIHDRKSTVGFMASYWPWKERLNINFKYNLDFGLKQRFKVNAFMLNLVFVTNTLTGSK